jgi:hypothetical protein
MHRFAVQAVPSTFNALVPSFYRASSSAAKEEGGSVFARHPFLSQLVVATTKTSIADIIVQKQVEKRETIDWRRNLVFTSFGFGFLGFVGYGIYVKACSRLFPAMGKFCNQTLREKLGNRAGLTALFQMIALDFVFIQPVIYWPVLYVFQESIQTQSENTSALDVVKNAMAKVKANFWEDNLGMCAFWLPMDLIIYSAPLHLRMPLNHAISFIWVSVVSFMRGGD